jgi:hypothetical protein
MLDAHHCRQVIDLIYLGDKSIHARFVQDRIVDEMKLLVAQQVLDVADPASGKVVHDRHLVSIGQQYIHEIGTDEPGAAGDQNPHIIHVSAKTDNQPTRLSWRDCQETFACRMPQTMLLIAMAKRALL